MVKTKTKIKTTAAVLTIALVGGAFAAAILVASNKVSTVKNSTNISQSSNQKQIKSRPLLKSGKAGAASDRILVKFKKSVSREKRDKIFLDNNLRAKGEIGQIGVEMISIPEGASPEGAIKKLQEESAGDIEFAELNIIPVPDLIPNDPLFSQEWHLPKINAPQAWDATSGSGATIAIIDSGVDASHPDLKDNLVSGWNLCDNNSDTGDWGLEGGHGTLSAGAAAAVGNNASMIAGAAFSAKIMPLRINSPAGCVGTLDIFASAIIYAADHSAKIANISYGCGANCDLSNTNTIKAATAYMKSKGGLTVFSAGNYGSSIPGRANNPDAIVVAATDASDNRASWSNYGSSVDIAAPGENILSTAPGGSIVSGNGTSLAAPITAGTLALIWSANPSLTADQARQVLFSSAKDLGTSGWDQYYGWGRVDAGVATALASGKPLININSPNGGEKFSQNNIVPIKWSSAGVNTVSVDLYKNDTLLKNIATRINNAGSYNWTVNVSSNEFADSAFKIKITGYKTDNSSVADLSDNAFSITGCASASDCGGSPAYTCVAGKCSAQRCGDNFCNDCSDPKTTPCSLRSVRETDATCPADCKKCAPEAITCGPNEQWSCLGNYCHQARCGDGYCNSCYFGPCSAIAETAQNCPADCE